MVFPRHASTYASAAGRACDRADVHAIALSVGQSVRVKIAPRPLTSDEHAVLDLLLSVDFDGATDLRTQARKATVVGRCDCGCPTVDLAVPDTAPAAGLHGRVSPVEGRVTTHGDEAPGEIILFLKGGRLDSLEYVYYDLVPASWPPIDRIVTVG
jgi:hypothetical protein